MVFYMIKVIEYLGLLITFVLLFNYFENKLNVNRTNKKNIYYKKRFMTDNELNFYNKIKTFENEDYKIVPQVNLATIIEKNRKSFNNDYLEM